MSSPVHSEVRHCLFNERQGFRAKVVPQVLQGILKLEILTYIGLA